MIAIRPLAAHILAGSTRPLAALLLASALAISGCSGGGSSQLTSAGPAGPSDAVIAVASRATPGRLLLLDAATGATVASIPVTARPATDVAVNVSGTMAYVTGAQGAGATQTANRVSVVDLAARTETATITVPSPFGVVAHPDGSRIYVTSRFHDRLSVIDAATGAVTVTLAAGPAPHFLAIAPDGSHVYVPVSGGVKVLRTSDDTFAATITRTASSTNFEVAVSPDGLRVYGSDGPSGATLVAWSAAAPFDIVATRTFGGFTPRAIAVAPDGRVYVTLQENEEVQVLDGATLAPIDTLQPDPIGGGPVQPQRAYVNRDGKRLYISIQSQDRVYVFDLEGGGSLPSSSAGVPAAAGMDGFRPTPSP